MEAPPGYDTLSIGHAEVVARTAIMPAIREALAEAGSDGTLYDFAAHHAESRALAGRGVAYAVPLPLAAAAVVVRRSRHGGLLAPISGEHFLGSTRAPRELNAALRLEASGVPTAEVLAYATYPSLPFFRRADVLTREVPGSRDLASALANMANEDERRSIISATAQLLALMGREGVRHPDLNLTNVLIAPNDHGELEAILIDVDRVWFDEPGAKRVTAANLRRFARSARKLRRFRGIPIDDADLAALGVAASQSG